MTLANLSRSATNKACTVASLEQFLEGAEAYANGLTPPPLALLPSRQQPMVSSGFRLSQPLRQRLIVHAKRQQISRSRLLRILINHFDALSKPQQQRLLNEHSVR